VNLLLSVLSNECLCFICAQRPTCLLCASGLVQAHIIVRDSFFVLEVMCIPESSFVVLAFKQLVVCKVGTVFCKLFCFHGSFNVLIRVRALFVVATSGGDRRVLSFFFFCSVAV
jgi:hypothetical protein